MSQVVDHRPLETATPSADLASAIEQVLRASEEPLTVSKIKTQLPTALRSLNVEETLQRQVSANLLHEFPKYRSPHSRYWDRPMPQHIAVLLRQLLAEEALGWSDLKRKLPAYAVERGAEAILQEQIAQGKLHRHPKIGSRGGERYGVRKPDPKDYLRNELIAVFGRLQQLGFSESQLRQGALELLHEEEWATLPAKQEKPTAEAPNSAPAGGKV